MVYFISEAKIKEMCNDNISSEIIKTGIINVQTIQLKEIIGDSLAKTLETLITNNVVVEPYKTLLDSYIQPYMQYAVLAEIVVPATYKIGNIGLNQPYTDNVNTTTKSECVYVKQYYTERAAFMENRLTTYLEANRAVFTDYQNYKDITVAKSTTTQAGLFLGGKTRGNSVDNTTPTFIHDNTIRAYIRYDEAQNLTPDQQKLAQKNIGLEIENGDIDIDINLDNYYTKDEVYNKNQVDTKLEPYITDNEVNLRLTSYYDKNTVNNLLDNLPIPEYTSELVKDDVYTKEETDTAIQNAIENLPTSGGGGGDYNDLINKPIVDLLSLPNNEQVSQIDFYSDIFMFVGGYIMTIEGIILNGNKCVYEIIGNSDDGMPIKQVDFYINRTQDSFIVRFITRYSESGENIPYEFIYTNENGDMLDSLNLVTKAELEETIGNINNLLNTI